MQLDQATLYALLAAGIMLLVGFPVHEFSHAWAAWRLGDSTARWQGRLTLNPIVHFDQVGGLMLLITAILSNGTWFFGYAKPTPVNPMNLREGRRGEALVAAAGPVSNLVMAAIVAIPLRILIHDMSLIAGLPLTAQQLVVNVPYYFVVINVFLFIFNLIPIPPLDGWRVLGGLVPPRTAWQLREFEQRYAMVIPLVFLVFILFFGGRVISPIADTILNVLLGDLTVASWWGGKVRQTLRHVTGRVSREERTALEVWLTPAQLDLFGRMHPADRRHGLDVVAALRAEGHDEPPLLLAALFHDASKGPHTRLVHRVVWSLGERYGTWVWRVVRPLPTFDTALDRIASHAVDSALLAQAAGCPDQTASLIRHQARPRDPILGEALRLADEAS